MKRCSRPRGGAPGALSPDKRFSGRKAGLTVRHPTGTEAYAWIRFVSDRFEIDDRLPFSFALLQIRVQIFVSHGSVTRHTPLRAVIEEIRLVRAEGLGVPRKSLE